MGSFNKALVALWLYIGHTTAAYTLQEDYGNTDSFFSKFSFWTGADPTNGFVQYVDQATAETAGLISSSDGAIYIGVDSTNVATSPGRRSVRLTSHSAYNHGLVILDLAHMPGSVCGAWPAFWMLGADWPNNGEIDIIEGVSQETNNAATLHTSEGCTIDNTGFTGTLQTSNCYVYAAGQSNNAGCGIKLSSSQSYGDGFNSAGGGVYATEWTSSGIKVWFFTRDAIPADISSGTPDPTTWSTPSAAFAGNCDFEAHFNNLQIVFDITFCGDWAGSVWSSSGSCPSLANTCQDYVANSPGAFASAYWRVNSLRVYQDNTL